MTKNETPDRQAVLETITPEMADAILQRHFERMEAGQFTQRSISPKIVNKYANDMKAGNWIDQPNPIVFDENEDLINGQHRLMAVKKAGIAVPMRVSRGWPIGTKGAVSTIDVVDQCRPRTNAQMLHLHGTPNANAIAAAVNLVVSICNRAKNVPVSYGVCLHILDKLNLRHSIEAIALLATRRHEMKGITLGPIAYYHTARPRKAVEFATTYFNMEWEKGSPIHAFALWQKSHGKIEPMTKYCAICAAIRMFEEGRTDVRQIKPTLEAMDYVADLNPKLKSQILEVAKRFDYGK